MAIVDTGYAAILTGRAGVAGKLSDVTTSTELQNATLNGGSEPGIDWSTFNRTSSHQVISMQENACGPDHTLDGLVNDILSHIGDSV